MDHSQCEINPPGGTEGELYQFQVSQSIIGHLVERQAGSIEKAILETVTNGIDAKATRITIDFDGRGRVVIADNGHGFDSRASVEKHFAIFGFSHDSTEEQARERENRAVRIRPRSADVVRQDKMGDQSVRDECRHPPARAGIQVSAATAPHVLRVSHYG